MIIETHFGFKMESSEEIIDETDEKAPEVDLKVLEAIKAKELAEDRFRTIFPRLTFKRFVDQRYLGLRYLVWWLLNYDLYKMFCLEPG